jgi:Zn-dependent alcohol dehydrogenase
MMMVMILDCRASTPNFDSVDAWKQIQVIGSYGARARQDLPKLVRLAESGIFNLSSAVSRKYKFEEAGQAFHDLNQGNIISRAVVEIM